MSIKLFYRPTDNELEVEQLVEKNLELREKSDVFLRSIDALLHFLKSFAIDVKEIRSECFKESIDELNRQFASDEKPKRIELHFEHRKNEILSFIDHQHDYIADREKELRDIIELLTKAMANLDVENRDFYHRVYDHSEKMEKITRLDDIKKIKTALAHEVSQMRVIVDLKKDQDRRRTIFGRSGGQPAPRAGKNPSQVHDRRPHRCLQPGSVRRYPWGANRTQPCDEYHF
jgi:hypothetical protein